jgi:hypothetical protein
MIDCGNRCAPYNDRGVPVCCDPQHAIPTAFYPEWEFLRTHTNLWRLWRGSSKKLDRHIRSQLPEGQILISCLGHTLCQRNFRSISCRAFPFFPYLTSDRDFIGLGYYWEYEDRCWVINNLEVVEDDYRRQFIQFYMRLFADYPTEVESYYHQSARMRQYFGRLGRSITLLARKDRFKGDVYKITPGNERMRKSSFDRLPKFGVFKLAEELPFPDEIAGDTLGQEIKIL